MTELTECVRTEDEWLLQVQTEMREGNLSEDSWKFLHGEKTTVPGSYVNGRLCCKNNACWETWKTSHKECSTCQQERKSKHRVMNNSNMNEVSGRSYSTGVLQ